MATCTISGTTKNLHEAPVGGKMVTIRPLAVTGQLIETKSFTLESSRVALTLGEFEVDLIRGGSYRVEGYLLGIDAAGGLEITIPNAAEADLESLIAAASIPTQGLTIKDEGTALASLIGTMNFTGAGVSVAQASAGVATVTITGGSGSGAAWGDITGTLSSQTDLQTVLNLKAPIANPTFTGTVTIPTPFTLGAVPVTPTGTELNFVAGVTSAIQTQINNRLTQAAADALYSVLAHNHSGVYEAANANIQSHISSTSNPHSVTKTQVGLSAVENTALSTWAGSANITTLGTIATGAIPGTLLTLTDVTTNNATASNHGFLPKLSGSASDFLNGAGAWAVPASGGSPGGSTKQIQFNSASSFGGATGFEYQSGASPNVLIQSQAAAHVALVAKGAVSQSVDVFQVQNSSALAVFKVDQYGNLLMGNTAAIDSTTSHSLIFMGARLQIGDNFTVIRRNATSVFELSTNVAGNWAALKLGTNDALTNAVSNGLYVGHQSSGTPAAGLGSGILFNINSSTTADQNAAQIAALWTNATHASRTADIVFNTVNNAAALAQAMRLKADSRLIVGCPNSAPTDADIANSFFTAYLDQTANKLHFRVRYSDGSLKTAELALT